MATKYCAEHDIWYDYRESCPECHKFAKIAGKVIGSAIGITIGGVILGGRKIYEKVKEDNLKKIEDDNRTIQSKIFCSHCGTKIFGDVQFCSKCGAKL